MTHYKQLTILLIIFSSAILFSCKEQVKKEESIETSEVKKEVDTETMTQLADSIAMHAQKTLLSNVAKAIQKGGTEYAVDFCNTSAITITDSIADLYTTDIQRITNKPRNPDNHLATAKDSLVWSRMYRLMEEEGKLADGSLEHDGDTYFYYKPIAMGMPTCVKCHGGANDINARTKDIINKRYPNDQATGYKTGDFRGLWKIKMESI